MNHVSRFPLIALAAFLVCDLTSAAFAQSRPNIVLIMVDDMGFSDIGCYGGETETPHLDGLAKDGIRFTQFYNAGRCCPTRASLLTGLYQHQAGVGHMTRDDDHPSYRGYLNDQCVTLAEALGSAGYFTAISGKWHVGSERKHWPLKRGFDRFYGTPQGGGHHYRNLPGRNLVLNDEVIPIPEGWYSTTAFTDHALKFLEEGLASERPVFLYLAYTAPHWPLQAPDDVIAKFRGRYSAGWQPVREARFQRQMEMGMFSTATQLSPQDSKAPDWSKVNDPDEVDLRLATHAAMVHLVDQGIGRIVSKLRTLDQLDNTLILFLSDNGASAESGPTGFTGNRGGDPNARTGTPDSYNSFGISGANLCDTPFRKYKMLVHEGGIATPLIAHWPNGIPSTLNGRFSHELGHIIDVLPTCLDLAKADYPTQYDGSDVTPVEGRSLMPALKGNRLDRPEGLFFEHQGNAAVRVGDWKLVRAHRKPWALYNLQTDRTELQDVSKEHPELTRELKEKWRAWADRVGVEAWPIKKK